jgi:hypothetical protein
VKDVINQIQKQNKVGYLDPDAIVAKQETLKINSQISENPPEEVVVMKFMAHRAEFITKLKAKVSMNSTLEYHV